MKTEGTEGLDQEKVDFIHRIANQIGTVISGIRGDIAAEAMGFMLVNIIERTIDDDEEQKQALAKVMCQMIKYQEHIHFARAKSPSKEVH